MQQNVLKGSVQRQIKNAVLELYPSIRPYINQIFPKKGGNYSTIKWFAHLSFPFPSLPFPFFCALH